MHNALYSKGNENIEGKLAEEEVSTAKYSVLIEIQVEEGTGKYLEDNFGRRPKGQQEYGYLEEHTKEEKKTVVMKLERIKN